MNPKTLVLFDIDGTLLVAAGSGRVATERAMLEIFGTMGKLHEHRFSGKTDWHTLVYLLTPEGFSEADIEASLSRYNSVMGRHLADIIGEYKVEPLPGTFELIAALKARPDVLLGIITGNVRETADLKLHTAGFALQDFPVGVYGHEARVRRDLMPIIHRRAEEHSGATFEPSDIVVIGDTPDDIDCGHAIGARVIAVATGWIPREELEKFPPVTVLDNLADTGAVLRLITGYGDGQ